MAGIYIHIPFCRQACFYCNFHFATSLTHKNELLNALLRETEIQKDFLENETVETIYFGGGTPSILQNSDLETQVEKIRSLYTIMEGSEITLEANPDDITKEKLVGWKKIGINRLSIGVQSFFDDDLQWMNRAHSAKQAMDNLQLAKEHFENITIDLIYGMPALTDEKWKQNVEKALAFQIPHLSCYALTVEPKTPLQKMISNKKSEDVNPEKQSSQFLMLMQWMQESGYEHYEISNFSKPGFRGRHNSSYWLGKKYLGIGPSAHSFNGESRHWNISNNNNYIESIRRGILPIEKEILSPVQQLNEYIMTSLRTMEGIDLKKISEKAKHELITQSKKFIERGLIKENNECLILTKEGKLLADGIAADLFFD